MKIGVSSLFDCVVDANGKKYHLHKNFSRLEIELDPTEKMTLLVYPVGTKKLLSYAVNIFFENGIICDSPYADVFRLNENEFEIELKKMTLFSNDFKTLSKQIINGQEVFLIQGDPNYFCVLQNDKVYAQKIDFEISKFDFQTIQNFPAVLGRSGENKFLTLFNTKNNRFFNCFGINVYFENDIITEIKSLYNTAHHARIRKYKFDQDGGAELVVDELVYLDKSPNIIKSEKVLPFAFFEAIKQKDFLLAKSYLSEKLAKGLNVDAFEEYFGQFDKILPYHFSQKEGHFVCLLSKKDCKIFCVEIKDGKIIEIKLESEFKYNLN